MPYVIKISSDGGNSYVDMFQHTGVKPKNTFNRTLIHRHLIADEHSFKPRCLYIKEFGKIKILQGRCHAALTCPAMDTILYGTHESLKIRFDFILMHLSGHPYGNIFPYVAL
jgi:hypothetical protein